ncbi:tyrosine-protein kinase STYK1 isoform X2 [Electrophorus electricus]|uniref:tyrosine-protein kinase STYK1 isoform X2 n=1 Tax=Electrophorus electricus TaxID=8005 RepID=UPI0015D00AF2|nr:tyrosine-protein kinase STYK1 isoform X2 [Electrophorus electricus]
MKFTSLLQRMKLVREYEKEIIVVPVLLLVAFLSTLLALCLLRLRSKKDFQTVTTQKHQTHNHHAPRHHHRNRQHLQGIEAPPELNPLESEAVPITAQTQNDRPWPQMSTEMSTEIQHGSFQQITPLTLSFTVHPNKSVTLYHAIKDQRAVILRVLKATANTKEHQAFLGFAHFLSDLGPHPCLPLLLGPVTVGPPLIMVMEELVNRDLLGFLWRYRQEHAHRTATCNITEKQIFIMGGHIASALFYNILIWKQEFLHSKNCTHGNVRARSVLVGQDLSVKLWGFGPAFHRRMEAGSSAEIEVMEMRKWQAPEVLAHRPVSHSSDIWSFGILLYEMVTFGEPPFPKIMACELLQHLQRGKSLQRPANCSISLYSNMKACCQWRPQDRPTLTDLISKLKQGGRRANDRVMLRVPEPIDMEKYMREAGYGERYNYAFL